MSYYKYYLYKEQISYDGGTTWQDVTPSVTTPSGDPIGTYETYEQCTGGTPEIQYRWTQSGTTCIGYNKYQNNIKEQSTDGGSTWTVVIPEEYSASTLIEADSPDCGYVPPTPTGCTCDAFSFSGTSEGNNTYRIEIPSGETAVTAATWNTDCGIVPQDFTHTDDSEFQVIVTDGHWIFDNNLIKFTASTNSTNFVREGNMTITYTVDGNSCTKVTHLVQAAGQGFNGRYKLTLNNSNTVTAACNSTSSITSGDVSSRYSGTVVTAEIGSCVNKIAGRTFRNCTSLTSVIIPNSVTIIDFTSFDTCYNLTGITIPNSVTTIAEYAFYDCSGLTGNLTIPDSVTIISSCTFGNCSSLTSCAIGSGTTTIGKGAFSGCTSLTSCTIGSGVTSIGDYAFKNTRNLQNFTIYATTPPTLGTTIFQGTSSNLIIYVPSESVDTYKATNRWKNYASRIQPIS